MNAKEMHKYERKEELRWLEMYHKTVVGLAALAEMYGQGLETEWMAMINGLDALATMMQEDIDIRKKEIAE